MKYSETVEAVFLARRNRFIAEAELAGERVRCHLNNTGRLRELLVSGARCVLVPASSPGRATAYDLVAVYSGDAPVNIDSLAPNRAAAEYMPALFPDASLIRREYVYADSRLDLCVERGAGRRTLIEVKGVTLVRDGVALFPDAPTERGIKHLRALSLAVSGGEEACILFVIQRSPALAFSPNDATHPAFGEALRRAAAEGVRVMAVDSLVTPGGMSIRGPVPVKL